MPLPTVAVSTRIKANYLDVGIYTLGSGVNCGPGPVQEILWLIEAVVW